MTTRKYIIEVVEASDYVNKFSIGKHSCSHYKPIEPIILVAVLWSKKSHAIINEYSFIASLLLLFKYVHSLICARLDDHTAVRECDENSKWSPKATTNHRNKWPKKSVWTANEERNTSRDHSFKKSVIYCIEWNRIDVRNAHAELRLSAVGPLLLLMFDIVHSEVTVYRIQAKPQLNGVAISLRNKMKMFNNFFHHNWLRSSAWFICITKMVTKFQQSNIFTYFNVHVSRCWIRFRGVCIMIILENAIPTIALDFTRANVRWRRKNPRRY